MLSSFVDLGDQLGELPASRLAELRDIVGDDTLNSASAFNRVLQLSFFERSSALEKRKKLHAAGFDARLSAEQTFSFVRKDGTSAILVETRAGARALARRMVKAGVELEGLSADKLRRDA
jgi:hypothetical protein